MTERPVLLDLFCGAGGASVGYARAGFKVIGVDIKPQPNYPFEFFQNDAIEVLRWWRLTRYTALMDHGIAAVHASPPCQAYSDLQRRSRRSYPQLIEPVRRLLQETRLPWVIENVPEAPLRAPIILCGTMFPGLRVIRHRAFEASFPLAWHNHGYHPSHPLVFTYDKRKAHYGQLDQDTSFVQVTGGGNCTVANKRAAMGVGWMNGAEANEAIPPAYTEFIGAQLLAQIGVAA
jgi:DNA (cytosine-5)-methyltransferase 1